MLYSKQERGRMAPFSFVVCLDLAAIQPAAGFELIRKQMTIQQATIKQYRLVVDGIGETEWLVHVGYAEDRKAVVLSAGRDDVLPHLCHRRAVRDTGGSNLDYRVHVFDGIFRGHGTSL